ncbi:hypothetical protein [Nocardia sp. NPDC049707]|uniref:hypothetical protein n=1 Tax=Nocardia sp. NPDC049707 TaxID=3154735 RepID=UPI00342CF09D
MIVPNSLHPRRFADDEQMRKAHCERTINRADVLASERRPDLNSVPQGTRLESACRCDIRQCVRWWGFGSDQGDFDLAAADAFAAETSTINPNDPAL